MTSSQQWAEVDALACRVDAATSLEQKVEALLRLGEWVRMLSTDGRVGSDPVEDQRTISRSSLIAVMTPIGELPEFSSIEPFVAAETGQRIRTLCKLPVSLEVIDEVTTHLRDAARSAAAAADELLRLQDEIERARNYRDVLRDMLSLLDLLSDRDGATVKK